jgi:hypothetical protein
VSGRAAIPCLFALAALSAAGAGSGVKTEVVGGTVAAVPAGTGGRLDLTGADALVLQHEGGSLRIVYEKVNTLEYGQNVSRRYAAAVLVSPVFLLSKSRKHFVTLGFLDAENRQQALVLRIGKGEIRSVLAGLEARTGRRVEYQDNEARKSGKGS